MANTRVEAYGHDKNRTKETSMLGSEGVTIHTFSITEPEGR